MRASSALRSSQVSSHPHAEFLALHPLVERHARITFRHRHEADREEAVAEAVAAAFVAYVGLKQRGQDPVRDFPSVMATFAVLHVKNQRHVGGRSSSRDVLSGKAQQKHGFQVTTLPGSNPTPHEQRYATASGQRQQDALEEYLWANTQTPVVEQVCFRLDWPVFLRTLCRRDRGLARYLTLGHSAQAAAQKFQVSPGRLSQLRRQWYRAWLAFQGEGVDRANVDPGLAPPNAASFSSSVV